MDLGTDIATPLDEGGIDLDPKFSLIDGAEAVAASVVRAWLDPDGMDLRGMIGKPIGPVERLAIRQRLVSAALEDERVSTVSVAIVATPSDVSVEGQISVDGLGPFSYVLTVDRVRASLVLEGAA